MKKHMIYLRYVILPFDIKVHITYKRIKIIAMAFCMCTEAVLMDLQLEANTISVKS
jgi:hypothetical protein